MKDKQVMTREKKYEIRNGKELTEKEYVAYLEGMAYGIWMQKYAVEGDGHSKMSDPLYIDPKQLNDVYSYVFDFIDGGRHHSFKSLKEIEEALIEETKKLARFYRTGEME